MSYGVICYARFGCPDISAPTDLLRHEAVLGGNSTPHFYSPDNNDNQYSRSPDVLFRATGVNPAYRLNAGLLRVQRCGLSLDRIDETVHKLGLLSDQPLSHYAEQTLYACELPHHGAVRLDPERYTICGDPNSKATVTGHYCGGGYWGTRFYREGVPRLVEEFFPRHPDEAMLKSI